MDPSTTLAALGFTDVEAQVYCELLRAAPATGYRLAQTLGKAPANVAQVLNALAQKGAVLLDEGEPRTFRPVPPKELLSALEREFQDRKAQAGTALEAIYAPSASQQIYQLKNPRQVMERAREMISGARATLMFDLFPAPLALLKSDLEQAAARGVQVNGVVYGPIDLAGVKTNLGLAAEWVSRSWPGDHMTIVADGRELLIALLTENGGAVRHGMWSDGAYLAFLLHNGISAEMLMSDGLAPTEALQRLVIPRALGEEPEQDV